MDHKELNNRIIENPAVQDKVTFLETSDETGGAHSLILVDLAAGGGNSDHYHDIFTEEFIAVEGILTVVVEGQTIQLQPGESHLVNLFEEHAFYNRQTERIKFQVKISPGNKDFEAFLQIMYGLAKDGKTNNKGIPKSFWDIAAVGLISNTLPAKNTLLHFMIPFFKWLGKKAEKRGKLAELKKRYVRI